jgi:large subunit ribosomal protein L25
MEQILLDAELRSVSGKAVRQLRRQGYVPAVVYGHRTEPISLQVPNRALHQALRVAGSNRLIALSIQGQEAPRMVLVRELQRDALDHAMMHVDFYEVVMTEKITAEVPISFVGESRLVKSGGGLLFQGLDTIEIECLPGDLPEEVEIDLSQLVEIDQGILVRDLKLGEGIEILTELDDLVVKILPPTAEEVEEVVAEAVTAEVELVGKKPKEGEEEEAGKEKQPAAEGKEKKPAAEGKEKKPAAEAKEKK